VRENTRGERKEESEERRAAGLWKSREKKEKEGKEEEEGSRVFGVLFGGGGLPSLWFCSGWRGRSLVSFVSNRPAESERREIVWKERLTVATTACNP